MVTIDETRLGHIFRDAEGHFAEDTAGNRQILMDVANDPACILGADQLGNMWATKMLADGSQVWVQIRDGQITNGGINAAPRALNPSSGLSVATRPGSPQ